MLVATRASALSILAGTEPALSSVHPSRGPIAGGILVTVTATLMDPSSPVSAQIDGEDATVVSDTREGTALTLVVAAPATTSAGVGDQAGNLLVGGVPCCFFPFE